MIPVFLFKKMKRRLLSIIIGILIFQLPLFSKDNRLSYSRLDGDWELYFNKTPEQVYKIIQEKGHPDCLSTVPGFWNNDLLEITGSNDPKIYGCYRYVLKNLNPSEKYAFLIKDAPQSACAVLVNNEILAQNGAPFPDKVELRIRTKNEIKPLYGEFSSDENGIAEIVVFINNRFYRKSGLWDSFLFGKAENIFTINNILISFYTIISAILIFIGLLNLIQFIINHKKLEYLYLGITAIIFSLRVSTAGYCSLSFLFNGLSAQLKIKLEYMTLWLVPICILQMITTLYPIKDISITFKKFKEKYLRQGLLIIDLILGILSLILPAELSNQMVPILQAFLGIISLYVIIVVIIKTIQKEDYIIFYLFSCGILIIGGIIDTIYTKFRTFIPASFFPFFLVLFIFIQIYLLAKIQNDLYKDTVKITSDLKFLNEAYLRFVPKEFLKLLNKDSITNIKLGDNTSIEMGIMFSKLNIEKGNLSPEEHFKIFNEFLENISPIIKHHNGFVSKFLSGGFMALFPKTEIDTIITALKIVEYTNSLNDKYKKDRISITPRIGIHYGKMIVGTIGEENRMDDTVISDTVNTVSRIESVCELLNKKIIISHNIQERINTNNNPIFNLTELESIQVKGKQKPLKLYECQINNF